MRSLWRIDQIIVFLVLTGLIVGCKNSNTTEPTTAKKPVYDSLFDEQHNPLPSDFVEFYHRFQMDSVFQLEHIVFPLKGLPDHADPDDIKDGEYYYTRDQWIIQKEPDAKASTIRFINMADIIIEERITEHQHQLMVIRRYAKTSGGWGLIYYAGINKYKFKEGGE